MVCGAVLHHFGAPQSLVRYIRTFLRTTGFTKDTDFGWTTENVRLLKQSPYLQVRIEGVSKAY